MDGASEADVYTEIMLNEGFPLTSKVEEVAKKTWAITHEDVPFRLLVCLQKKKVDEDFFAPLKLAESDHLVMLDVAFGADDSFKLTLDNQCKLFTI